jgi:hypothetical protein
MGRRLRRVQRQEWQGTVARQFLKESETSWTIKSRQKRASQKDKMTIYGPKNDEFPVKK